MGLQGVNKFRFLVMFTIAFLLFDIPLQHFFPGTSFYHGVLGASALILFIIAVKDSLALQNIQREIEEKIEDKAHIHNKAQLNIIALDRTETSLRVMTKAENDLYLHYKRNEERHSPDTDKYKNDLSRVHAKIVEIHSELALIRSCQSVTDKELSKLDIEIGELHKKLYSGMAYVVFELISICIIIIQIARL